MSVEQIFDDIDACRNQILSALGQDPNHDFRDGGRTYKQDDVRGRDIAKKMEDLLTFCDRKRIAAGGSRNKVGGGNSNLGQLILSPEVDNQQIMVIANNISTDFVKSTSNLIFSGGISLAIRAASVLTFPDTDGSYNEIHNKSVTDLLNYNNLQENFIGDALNVLTDLNKITTYKFVKSHYDPLIQALKDPINNNISHVLTSVENASILSLNNQVSDVLAGSGNTCLFDLESAIALINRYATDENVNIPAIDANLFVQLSKVDQINQLSSVLKKIKFKLHPDKQYGKSDDEKQQKEELFKDANNEINDMIENCFKTGELLGQKRKFREEDTGVIDDASTIQQRRKVKVRRRAPLNTNQMQFGGKKERSKLSIANDKILNASTMFMMNWLGVAEYTNNKVNKMTIENTLTNIFDDGGADYLMRDSKVHIGRKINPARIILNAQIMILWVRTNFESATGSGGFKNYIKRFPLNPNYFDVLSIAKKKGDDNYWLGQTGDIAKITEVGFGNIDNQLQEAHNIVIRAYHPEAIYKDGLNGNDKFLLTSEKDKLDDNAKNIIGVDKDKKVSFVVNNAALLPDIDIGGLSGDALAEMTFCPIASILDAMKGCSIDGAIRDRSTALYPMTYTIRSINNEFLYTVDYRPTPDNDSAVLNATLSKSIDAAGNAFTISKRDLIFKDNDLSATEGYRGIVDKLYAVYTTRTNEGIVIRGKDMISAFQDFLSQVMSDVIGSFAVKSIGDYAQEGTVTSKFSGLEYEREGRLAEDYFDSPRLLSPTHEQGFSFRIGLAGDRPSAYRMIDTLLFANPESINIDAIVGYVRKNDEKNFLVIHPGIASEVGPNYTPQELSKSLLRSKYCESNPTKCNMDDVVPMEIDDSPTSVSDIRHIRKRPRTMGGKKKQKTRKRKYKKRKTNKRKRRKKKTKRRKSTRKTKKRISRK